MPNITSRESAVLLAGRKISNVNALGRMQMVTITAPATTAWAQNDTINSPVRLPAGTKIPGNGKVFHDAMGAGVTMSIGLKKASDDTVIGANIIANALDVAAAGIKDANNGAAVYANATPDYVLTEDAYIYATLAGANPTDNTLFRIDIAVVLPG